MLQKSSFKDRVYTIVKNIPKGSTMSYKEVATLAGSPNASRAVGNVLNLNYDKLIPCHRVIKSDGIFGGYNRGESEKKSILENEQN